MCIYGIGARLDSRYSQGLVGKCREAGGLMDEQLVFVAPPVEAWIDRDKREYHLSFALPGVELPNIQLRLQANNLTISGDQNRGSGNQNKGNGTQQPDYLRNEFSLGPFQRTVRLPDNVDPEKLTARQSANGMVEIVAPLKEKLSKSQPSQRTS